MTNMRHTSRLLKRSLLALEPCIPERDLRCIFDEILFGEDLGAAMAVAGFVEEATDWFDISEVINCNS